MKFILGIKKLTFRLPRKPVLKNSKKKKKKKKEKNFVLQLEFGNRHKKTVNLHENFFYVVVFILSSSVEVAR